MPSDCEEIKALAASIDALSHRERIELLNLLSESSLETVEEFADDNFLFDWREADVDA